MIKAYAPGNVSCIFRIVNGSTKRHSLGVGFTVDKGVLVTVSRSSKTKIYANGRKIRFPTVKEVIKELTDEHINVDIKDQLPSGAGFGISGACALATSYAVNKLLQLGRSKSELAIIAHNAEVNNGTGLGDVGGQFNGGFNMKIKRGNPLSVVNLGVKGNVYYVFFSKIQTKNVINNRLKKRKINEAGDRALKRVKMLKKKGLEGIIRISKDFAVESGLLRDKKVKKIIMEIENNGGNATMIMLGNAVFSDIPFKGCKKLKISPEGACLL